MKWFKRFKRLLFRKKKVEIAPTEQLNIREEQTQKLIGQQVFPFQSDLKP